MIRRMYARLIRGLEAAEDSRRWRRIYRREAEGDFTAAEHLRMWRAGFLPQSMPLYRDNGFALSDHLTDRAWWLRFDRLNEDYALVTSDKLIYHRVMVPWAAYLPPLYGVLGPDGFRPEPGTDATTLDALLAERLRDDAFGGLVVKPARGAFGRGIVFVRRAGDRLRVGEARALDAGQAAARLLPLGHDGDHVVTELVEQAAYAAHIFPGAANTIRVVVMRDPEDGRFFTAAAAHRFGSARSATVDNFDAGGLNAEVDLATGRLGAAVQRGEGCMLRHRRHPDTEAPIEGVVVPRWKAVERRLLEISDSLSCMHYVGWDVLLTDTEPGFSLIEGNARAGVNVMQAHRPLLRDARVRRFFEARGVLD